MSGAGASVPFDEVDPFNPENQVRGFIMRSRRRRGDLQITHVNGEACAQYIHATPKIPLLEPASPLPEFERAHVFDKLDGTNILLFRYRDAGGRDFVSYKTRLSPFLRPLPYGDFVALWRQILERYAAPIAELVAAPHHFGFELFGRAVRILTDYPAELDARLLHAIAARPVASCRPRRSPRARSRCPTGSPSTGRRPTPRPSTPTRWLDAQTSRMPRAWWCT